MQRDIVQDIVPPERKSIRNIPLPHSKRTSGGTEGPGSSHEPPREIPPIGNRGGYMPRRRRSKKWWLIGGGCVVVIAVLFTTLSIFNSTILTVTPKQQIADVSVITDASRDVVGDTVMYKTISVTGEYGKVVPATDGGHVDTKASGNIIIYNDYSAAPQRLVATTRFETPQGLIYRIKDPVTVPGQTADARGKSVPGSTEVTIYADKAGADYNIVPTDFTVPGLKDGPRYEHFYARSTTAMSGGFSGTAKKVDVDVAAQAKKDIEENLKKQLLVQAQSTLPSDYMLLPAAISTNFEALPQTSPTDTSVQINERLVLKTIIINTNNLTDVILTSSAPEALGKAHIPNLSDLSYSIPDTAILSDSDSFKLSVTGQVSIVWDISETDLQIAFAGKPRSSFSKIIAGFPGVKKITVTLKPLWRQSFPTDPTAITIKTTVDEQ